MIIRSLAASLVISMAMSISVSAALAEEGKTSGRYGIAPTDDGFIRLDSATGHTSRCAKQDGVWRCEPIPDTGAALETRVDDMSRSLETLDDRVDDLTADVEALAAQSAVAAEKAVDNTAGFADAVVGRFKTMVRDMKRSTGWSL